MDAPFYLALGDVVIEAGEGAGPYHVQGMSFPEPSEDGYGGHLPAQREFGVKVTGADAATLSANIAALRREGVRDKLLRFKPTLAGQLLECRVRKASIVESEYDPLRRSVANPTAFLSVTIETDPYWLAPWGADVTPTVSAVPGHFDVAAPTGEVDALMRIRAIFGNNGKAAAIGIKPEPGTGYAYIDDYGASGNVTDSNARGGYKLASTGLDASLSAHWTAPDIDTNDNRGRHLLLARLDSNATTASSVTVRATTTTTGNAIAASTTVNEQTIACSSLDLIGYELGTVTLPAGQVPGIETGAGFAAPTIFAEQTASDAQVTSGFATQTVTLAKGDRITGFDFKTGTIAIDDAPGVTNHYVAITDADGAVTLASSFFKSGVPANTVKEVPFDFTAPSSGVYRFVVGAASGSLLKNTAGGYAGGGLEGASGQDLWFKVYAKDPLGFNTTNPIEAACTESSKMVNLDYVQRIPVDQGALVYRLASAGTLALYYDADTDTPYVADADGIGPAIYDKCEIRKPLRLKPGVVNRVVLGVTQSDEALTGATVTYAVRPRYLTATG